MVKWKVIYVKHSPTQMPLDLMDKKQQSFPMMHYLSAVTFLGGTLIRNTHNAISVNKLSMKLLFFLFMIPRCHERVEFKLFDQYV